MLEAPVLLLQGPRSVGKSTLLRTIAEPLGLPVIDLDNPAVRDAVDLDPTLYVAGVSPVLIDEYRKAPVILDAIKTRLNLDSAAGQFVLTGSTRYDALPVVAQSLTGRLSRVTVHPFTQAELEGSSRNLVHELLQAPETLATPAAGAESRASYVRRIVRGGFPLALAQTPEAARNRWFDEYLGLTLGRDAAELQELRRTSQLPLLFARLVGQTAQVLNIRKAAEVAGVDASTASDYVQVLEALFLLYRLPAWGKTLTSRTAKSPKLHILDSGIAARQLLLGEQKLSSADPTVAKQFGHLLETFVVNELLRQASWLDESFTAGHWRTHDSAEVDLILERDDGRILAIEVKASPRIRSDDFRSLKQLRASVGEDRLTGVIFQLGDQALHTRDNFHALPVSALWWQ